MTAMWPSTSRYDFVELTFTEDEMLVLDHMLHRMLDHQEEVWPALNAPMNPFWPKWNDEDAAVIKRLLAKVCHGEHCPIA